MPRDNVEAGGGVARSRATPAVVDFSVAAAAPPTRKPRTDQLLAPPSALGAASEIDATSGRRTATPVRKSFVRSDSGATPPLARLIQVGGRGGAVALKLYLALLWRCSSDPYETNKPHRSWATLLGLDDPEGNGARRIAAALKTLEALQLVSVRRVPAEPNVVTLLDETGDGSQYLPPSTEYARAPAGEAGDAQRTRNVYFKVPSKLWLEGRIQSLDGPGLAMLLILLAEQADLRPVWFSTQAFPQRYAISQKTRAAGTQQLVQRHLLWVDRQPLSDQPGKPSVFDRRRIRNLYELVGAAAPDFPDPPPAAAGATRPKRKRLVARQRKKSSAS